MSPGPHVEPDQVPTFPGADLYDPHVLRTIFIEFENDDWEQELEDFYRTDVDLPATLIVDGVRYPGAGVHFRGMSSYFTVPRGHKRSLNVSLDLVDPKQRLLGAKTLNLLNGHGDPSLMSAVLYSQIARQFLPAPKANFVQVVINGESWGVYANVQQFDRIFVEEHWGTGKGARWKVPGSPQTAAGLEYLGDDPKPYKALYEIKSKDREEDWKALIELCRILNTTPAEELQAALEPILDIEGVLRFLALDVALVNSDGYWTRSSDYNLYRDANGVFHIVPHDVNECFASVLRGPPGMGRPGMGPLGVAPPGIGPGDGPEVARAGGRAGGRDGGRSGVTLDPLVGLDQQRTPLRSRLLAVPALRERYLQIICQIAEGPLDWPSLGPVVARFRALIDEAVRDDTRKPVSHRRFLAMTADERWEAPADDLEGPRRPDQERGSGSLRQFSEERSAFLRKSCPSTKTTPSGP